MVIINKLWADTIWLDVSHHRPLASVFSGILPPNVKKDITMHHQEFQVRGTEPYKAILGVGVPLYKPYIQLI